MSVIELFTQETINYIEHFVFCSLNALLFFSFFTLDVHLFTDAYLDLFELSSLQKENEQVSHEIMSLTDIVIKGWF